jgi:hypothetical protein
LAIGRTDFGADYYTISGNTFECLAEGFFASPLIVELCRVKIINTQIESDIYNGFYILLVSLPPITSSAKRPAT